MRHFYKLVEGNMNGALVNAINQKREEVFAPAGQAGVSVVQVLGMSDDGRVYDAQGAMDFPGLRRLSLAILQLTDGVQLGSAIMLLLESKVTLAMVNPVPEFISYVLALHAQPGVMMMAGEEAVQMRSGDIWWIDRRLGDARIINKSDDEVIALHVEVRLGLR
jgi:hypothetical protein